MFLQWITSKFKLILMINKSSKHVRTWRNDTSFQSLLAECGTPFCCAGLCVSAWICTSHQAVHNTSSLHLRASSHKNNGWVHLLQEHRGEEIRRSSSSWWDCSRLRLWILFICLLSVNRALLSLNKSFRSVIFRLKWWCEVAHCGEQRLLCKQT